MPDRHRKKELETHENRDGGASMTAEAFRDWRKRLGLKQKDAAELLGLKKRMIQYYETGNRGGKAVSIPKSIRLACYALEAGIIDYDGTNVVTAPQTVRSIHVPLLPTAEQLGAMHPAYDGLQPAETDS